MRFPLHLFFLPHLCCNLNIKFKESHKRLFNRKVAIFSEKNRYASDENYYCFFFSISVFYYF